MPAFICTACGMQYAPSGMPLPECREPHPAVGEGRAIGAALAPFAFDRVYSHFFDRAVPTVAKQILQASIKRYVAAIGGAYDRT